jgi:hypothetical protein
MPGHRDDAVRVERRADVRVPSDALHELGRNTELQEQRDGRVPAIVEPHRARDLAWSGKVRVERG